MSHMSKVNERGGSRHDYPLWGMEVPVAASNAHRLYRRGIRGFWTRHIILPAWAIDEDRKKRGKDPLGPTAAAILRDGMTPADVLVMALAVGFFLLMAHLTGIGLDGYLDAMGM